MNEPLIDEVTRRQKRVTLLTVGLLSSVTLLLLVAGRHVFEPTRYLLGTMLLWLCAFPTWRYFSRGERTIPYLPLMGALYFFSYGLPAFNRVLRVNTFRPDAGTVEVALMLALAGMALLLIAFYWWLPSGLLPRLRLDLDLPANSTRITVLAAVVLGLRIVLSRTDAPLELAQLNNFIRFLPVVLLSALLLLRLRGGTTRWQSAVWVALTTLVLLLDLSTGAIAVPAFTIANLLFVYVAERGRLPVAALACVVTLLFPALATKQEYRHAITKRSVADTSSQLAIFAELIAGVLSGERMSFDEADEVVEGRVDHLSALSNVIARTPAVVPYWGGATYANFLWSFVPRVLAPDKPKKTLGQDYGHRYSFISRWNLNTSINLEQTVEMYANFGVPGVLTGMFLMGLLYRAFYTVLNHPSAGDGGVLVAAATFRVMLNIESDFSLVFGGLVQNALLLYLVLWLVARRRALSALAPLPIR